MNTKHPLVLFYQPTFLYSSKLEQIPQALWQLLNQVFCTADSHLIIQPASQSGSQTKRSRVVRIFSWKKSCLQNDLLCVKYDIKLYSLFYCWKKCETQQNTFLWLKQKDHVQSWHNMLQILQTDNKTKTATNQCLLKTITCKQNMLKLNNSR